MENEELKKLTHSEIEILATKLAGMISVQPRWMKLKQAAGYSSMGKAALIRLIEEKKIKGFQDNTHKTRPWVIDKNSIDEFRSRQADLFNLNNDEKIAFELVNGLEI